MSDSDEDIWDYQSIKRNKKEIVRSKHTITASDRRSNLPLPKNKTKTNKLVVKICKTKQNNQASMKLLPRDGDSGIHLQSQCEYPNIKCGSLNNNTNKFTSESCIKVEHDINCVNDEHKKCRLTECSNMTLKGTDGMASRDIGRSEKLDTEYKGLKLPSFNSENPHVDVNEENNSLTVRDCGGLSSADRVITAGVNGTNDCIERTNECSATTLMCHDGASRNDKSDDLCDTGVEKEFNEQHKNDVWLDIFEDDMDEQEDVTTCEETLIYDMLVDDIACEVKNQIEIKGSSDREQNDDGSNHNKLLGEYEQHTVKSKSVPEMSDKSNARKENDSIDCDYDFTKIKDEGQSMVRLTDENDKNTNDGVTLKKNVADSTRSDPAHKQTSLLNYFTITSQQNASLGRMKNLNCLASRSEGYTGTAEVKQHILKQGTGVKLSSPAVGVKLSSPAVGVKLSSPAVGVKLSSPAVGVKLNSPVVGVRSNETRKNKPGCPFYKWITGTNITVDAFSYGTIPECRAYFLTHFHYDHYRGLGRSFSQPLYCTQVTGNLVKSRIKVAERYITCLELNVPHVIEGVSVTLLEANHCPGSAVLLFHLRNGKTILHTGDFRAHPDMEAYPELQGLVLDQLYLDTTYCDPQYCFPPQEETLSLVVSTVLDRLSTYPHTLIVCGTYTIGKERVFTAIAEALDCKIAVTRDKKAILDCLDDVQLTARLTTDTHCTRLHVLTMKSLKYTSLMEYMKSLKANYTDVLAFEPTGWTYGRQRSTGAMKPKLNRDGIVIYGVPYSEHSSYDELRRFVRFLRPRHILPTVNNGNKAARERMEAEFRRWLS